MLVRKDDSEALAAQEQEGNQSQGDYRMSEGGLAFLEVRQGSLPLVGLVDTGAAMNCIGLKLAQKLRHEWIREGPVPATGLGGATQGIGRCEIKLRLVTGDEIIQQFVIMRELQSGIILGLPFLKAIGGVIDLRMMLMGSHYGDMELLPGFSFLKSNGWVGFVERDCLVEPTTEEGLTVPPEVKEKLKGTNLSEGQLKQTTELMMEFRELWEGERRGAAVSVRHRVTLTTDRPLKTRPRRFSQEQQQVIEKEIIEMEEAGVIEDSCSEFASDVVLVRKPTGEWRVCVDFRIVNDYTVEDRFPLPSLQDLVRSVKGSKYFVTLDLRSGYWQILMESESKKYTAFRTSRGLKQFVVMPFGLKNAPATFQRMMEEMFGDLHWEGVLVYLDDILVHGDTFEEVHLRLGKVFSRLREANLTLRLQKCEFYKQSIKYLGYIVSEGVLKPNPAKVEALRRAKIPTNVSELRSLLGLAGFYRQFIDHYAAKSEPLTRLMKKSAVFQWGTEQQEALKALMEGLEKQVLASPVVEEKLKLETDASDIAIGAILSCSSDGEHWRPVEFMSATLNETQRRWPVHEREAWAIVAALGKFDCYLRGREFVVYTDNSSLQWMAKAALGKIARWAARMAEYSMTVVHRTNQQMIHVDFLSRYVNPVEEGLEDRMTVWVATEETSSNHVPTLEEIVAAQKEEQPLWGKGFAAREGIIFYRSKYYVPPSMRSRVVAAGHRISPLLHNGMRKTRAIIGKVFGWPRMDLDIAEYVRACLACQRARPGIESLQGMVKRHDVHGAFEKVYIDLWSAAFAGKTHHCLTMIDSLTRWVEVVEVDNSTSEVVAAAFFTGWVSRFGVPTIVVSDRGPAFTGAVFCQVARRLGCHQVRSTPHHPEGNALIESFHRRLNRGLCLFSQSDGAALPFAEVIALILMGYRATIHEGLGESPAFLAHGVDLRPAEEHDWRFLTKAQECDRLRSLALVRLEIGARFNERAQDLEKAGLTSRESIQIGDLVLLRLTTPEMYKCRLNESSIKLQPKWSLPFRVIRITPDGQSAVVRNLVTFSSRALPIRRVHIRDLRFISPPQDEVQRREWETIISRGHLSELQDPGERKRILSKFWEEVETCELRELSEPRKRARPGEFVVPGETDL